MKTYFMNYKGEFVKAPLINGEILINAFDGSIVLFKDKRGNYFVRFCLALSEHETFKHAFNGFNHAIEFYLECEQGDL